MTDRELLELAAKAAGLEFLRWTDCYATDFGDPQNGAAGIELTNFSLWNPLDDDGDALRLAVTLGLGVDIRAHEDDLIIAVSPARQLKRHESAIIEEFGEDRFAATRRAIVRAAAKIWG